MALPAQQAPAPAPASPYKIITPSVQPTITPGQITLMELEGRFEQDVAKGGGKAFASWFADDAVALSNGERAVLGHAAIAAGTLWDPAVYQLTWTPEGAQMGPSNDMGFTWGHYQSRYNAPDGKPVIKTGRYITIWRKLQDGTWKVAMDASANEPGAPG
jgi:ketosteroid isomerase-like protein